MSPAETFAVEKPHRKLMAAHSTMVRGLRAAKALPQEVFEAAGLNMNSFHVLSRLTDDIGTFQKSLGALLAKELNEQSPPSDKEDAA